MDNKTKRKKKESDFAVNVFRVVQEATKEPEQPQPITTGGKNPNAVALARLGGLKGGKARVNKSTPEQTKGIAKKTDESRWGKMD